MFKQKAFYLNLLLTSTLFIGVIAGGNGIHTRVEAATYTAGITTVGPIMDNGNNNGMSATQVTTSSTGGTLDNIKVRIGTVQAAPNNHMRVAIYADNGANLPGARLGVSNSQVLTPNSWNTFTLTSSVTIAANTKYWLAFNVDGANTQYALERNVSGAVSAWKIPTTYGTWPNPFGTPSFTTPGEQYSIYMTYSAPDPTATPTPTNTPTPTPTPGGGQTYTAGYQTWNGTFDNGNNNVISATQVTTGVTGGTSQSISIYLGSVTAAPNNHIQVGIYADDGTDNPGTLLGSSPSQVITPNSWNTIALPGVTISPNTKYFLAFNLDGTTTQFGWNSTTTGISRWKFTTTFGTWPSTFGTPSLSQNQQYAIYLTYTSGFITASGTNFMLDGQQFRFIGFDAYGMEGCYDGSPWTTAQLDAYFSELPANGVTRIWAFRSYGTSVIQTILTEAAKYNQHVILVLGDDNSTCGETEGSVSGDHSGKTLEFYETGWQGPYLTWVNTVVPMFKDNPTIMMWEVANEPGQTGAVPPLSTMKAYLQGASDAIRANDPNHLISVGSNYPGNFGGLSNYIEAHNVPNINAVSFHDYSYEYENSAVVSGNFNAAKQASQQLNKPFYGGEAGVPAGATCSDVPNQTLTLSSRVTFLQDKANNYFSNGIGGLMYWEYAPSRASWVEDCVYEMYPGDPMINMVKNYILP